MYYPDLTLINIAPDADVVDVDYGDMIADIAAELEIPSVNAQPNGVKKSVSPALTVGWLEPEYAYTKSPAPEDFLVALSHLCLKPFRKYRGCHTCGFCGASPVLRFNGNPLLDNKGQVRHMGSGIIKVVTEKAVYYAPDMILHYVEKHEYLPPQEFIAAVLATKPSD